MREKKKRLIITFQSTVSAMAMEKKASEDGIGGRIIPLPTRISAGCGLAWRAEVEDREMIAAWLKKEGLSWEAMLELVI